MTIFQKGDEVIRKGSTTDYTTGRRGIIIETIPAIGKFAPRYRVHWLKDSSGGTINVRTWCMSNSLQKTNHEQRH